MRYDDPARPKFGVSGDALQVNGSPLPCVTLVRPMEGDGAIEDVQCTKGCEGDIVSPEDMGTERCQYCRVARATKWGWLANIHAHREGNRFGSYTGWIGDLGAFSTAFLEDPESALARYFKYLGPERVLRVSEKAQVPTLWED